MTIRELVRISSVKEIRRLNITKINFDVIKLFFFFS